MFKFGFLVILCLSCFSLLGQLPAPQLIFEDFYEIPGTSIRAIELDADSNLWFAGSNGRFGSIMGGKMHLDSLSYQGQKPSFRSLAVVEDRAFVLSIESPALLYKLPRTGEGTEAELVYMDDHPDAFYDALTFLDTQVGIAMGDPTDDCLSLLLSVDGGKTWSKKDCSELPRTIEGEAGFAASDTNIATIGDKIWIGTGGAKARVMLSEDRGRTWLAYDTPMAQGENMTGIYTIDFADEDQGIIMGGNWEKKGDFKNAKAITRDGGKTWSLVSNETIPGYISCVQYIPQTNGKELLACSTEGIFYSKDGGSAWARLSDKGYYSLRLESKDVAWMSKANEIVRVRIQRK